MRLELRVLPASGQPSILRLRGQAFCIGRAPECEIPLADDPQQVVSRRHARIEESAGALVLTDLGSTNGTFLNGVPVQGKMRLGVGDRIRLGNPGPVIEVLAIAPDAPPPGAPSPRQAVIPSPFAALPPGPPRQVGAAGPPLPGACPAGSPHAHSTREVLVQFMRKQTGMVRKTIAAIAALALVALVLVGLFFVYPGYLHPDYPQWEFRRTVAKVRRSVVHIQTPQGRGSGFVLDRAGTIVTNHHVVAGQSQATVVFADGTQSEVQGFVACLPGCDVVLLRVAPHRGFPPPLPLGDGAPAAGTQVFAFGSPEGLRGSVSQGIVSRVWLGHELNDEWFKILDLPGHQIRIHPYRDLQQYDEAAVWIQTDAPIHPGSSGGPLVDRNGRVLAVNTFGPGETLNFSSSVDNIRQVMGAVGTAVRPLAELPPKPDPKERLAEILIRAGIKPRPSGP